MSLVEAQTDGARSPIPRPARDRPARAHGQRPGLHAPRDRPHDRRDRGLPHRRDQSAPPRVGRLRCDCRARQSGREGGAARRDTVPRVVEPLLDERFALAGTFAIRRGALDWATQEGAVYTPELPISEDTRAWHPEDALFVPLRSSKDELLGVISVDEPLSGLWPERDELARSASRRCPRRSSTRRPACSSRGRPRAGAMRTPASTPRSRPRTPSASCDRP
jgi:hypothetical protein